MWLTLQHYVKDIIQLLIESTGICDHVYRNMWLTAISEWKYSNFYLLYIMIRQIFSNMKLTEQQYVTDCTAFCECTALCHKLRAIYDWKYWCKWQSVQQYVTALQHYCDLRCRILWSSVEKYVTGLQQIVIECRAIRYST